MKGTLGVSCDGSRVSKPELGVIVNILALQVCSGDLVAVVGVLLGHLLLQ